MQRIAARIAVAAALTAAGVGWLFSGVGVGSALVALVSGIAAGIAAYIAADRLIASRLKHVESVLNALYAEGGRPDRSVTSPGDELDRLALRADQSLHAVRKRMGDLNRAESYRREYVGDVSHEIKTPIFAIQGFAETLLNGALDDDDVRRGFVEKIHHHATRLNMLAKDLSEISRLETGALMLAPSTFSIEAMLEDVRESLEMSARDRGIDVRVDVGEPGQAGEGDRERIRQVLTNLVDNAIKYTNPGGWVLLRSRPSGMSRIELSVIDNGIGIAVDDIGRVTERFFRADKSRSRSAGGTGLGLSIVKHILAAHGTSLHIESRVGEGSTFSFTLPAASTGAGAA